MSFNADLPLAERVTTASYSNNIASSVGCTKVKNRPIRILHVLRRMDRGGVETWLMHVLRHIDRAQFRMDFMVHADEPGAYDEEIRELGSQLYLCSTPSNPIQYGWNFLRILRENGPFDVVHSHVHYFSGFVLRVAKYAGIAQRVAHSHTDTRSLEGSASFARKIYLRTCRKWIAQFASARLATSESAAESLFGPGWAKTAGTSLLYCGIDLEPFEKSVDRSAVKAELGFSSDDFVVGHVGRFDPGKNHNFLLKIHQELLKTNANAKLLLVGTGVLEKEVKAEVKSLGIMETVSFLGARSDVPYLMLGAMDAFVLPSHYEGLGLVALEAQAAGLPTVLSENVPQEVDLSTGLVRFVSLQQSPSVWAATIVEQKAKASNFLRNVALTAAKGSPFAIEYSTQCLIHLYKTNTKHQTALIRTQEGRSL